MDEVKDRCEKFVDDALEYVRTHEDFQSKTWISGIGEVRMTDQGYAVGFGIKSEYAENMPNYDVEKQEAIVFIYATHILKLLDCGYPIRMILSALENDIRNMVNPTWRLSEQLPSSGIFRRTCTFNKGLIDEDIIISSMPGLNDGDLPVANSDGKSLIYKDIEEYNIRAYLNRRNSIPKMNAETFRDCVLTKDDLNGVEITDDVWDKAVANSMNYGNMALTENNIMGIKCLVICDDKDSAVHFFAVSTSLFKDVAQKYHAKQLLIGAFCPFEVTVIIVTDKVTLTHVSLLVHDMKSSKVSVSDIPKVCHLYDVATDSYIKIHGWDEYLRSVRI